MSLQLSSIYAGYGPIEVLRDVTLSVKPGELTVVLGPNGAGKSTTLKVITGLLEAWKGTVAYDGRNITKLPAHERVKVGIAMVPEGRRLFPALTVDENLKLGSYTETARSQSQRTKETIYELFPSLQKRRRLKAGKLSGGEQQMLAIGRALMAKPNILVMDEPSLGLSPLLTQGIMEKALQLKKEGLTLLMVEQNAITALEIADYAYIMQEGTIIKKGTPSELGSLEELRKAYFSLS